MAHLELSKATLRIMGDELLPEEISKMLNAEPTLAHAKGHQFPSGPSGRIVTRKSGMWGLQASETEPEDLDGQVNELLGQLTTDLLVWEDIVSRFDVDLFCGWFMGSGNEGVEISPSTLLALGQRGIKLSLDIYGFDVLDNDSTAPKA